MSAPWWLLHVDLDQFVAAVELLRRPELRGRPVAVEVYGWDEAFVGAEVADPMALAADLHRAILETTGLSCAIGVGDNKSTAKIAARFGKPGGIFQLTAENWMAVMGDRPAAELWGVGPKTTKKLTALGLHTVADLAAAEPETLVERFGPRVAGWLLLSARGGGDTEVVTEPWVARSRSRETTYPRDLTDPDQIAAQVAALARELGADVVAEGRRVTHVAVKVRFASFYTPTREMKLRDGPTTDLAVIEAAALTVLEKFRLDRPVRLLGVRTDLELP